MGRPAPGGAPPHRAAGGERTRKRGEAAFAAGLLALSGVLLWRAYGISGLDALSSPGAFPMAVAAVMVASSALILLRTLRLPPRDASAASDAILPRVVLVVTGLVAAYALLLRPLGFLPTSLLFLTAAITLLGRGGVWRSLLVALGCLVGVFIVFRLVFSVLMPPGIVPEGEILAWLGGLLGGGP